MKLIQFFQNLFKDSKKSKIRRSLRYSFWDGFFSSIQFGIVDQFVTPLALFMGAGSAAIGILNFLRSTFVSTIQIFSAKITASLKSRKKLILFSVFTAALLWLPTYFVPFLFGDQKVWVFILLFAITSSFNMLASPAWASLMSEYIPPRKRGRYFGWRNMILGIVYCVAVLAAGIVLHYFEIISLFWGFAVLLIAASICRFISFLFLSQQYEPKWRVKTTDYFSFWDFISRFPQSNFARFTIFSAFLMLSVSLVSPFFAVYMLKELKFSYFAFTLLTGAAVITTFATQQYWGVFADKYGNMKIIKFTSLLIAMIPFLWLFSRDFYYLFFVQLWAGFLWAGLNLSSSNFIYDVAISTKRERCISYYNFLTGMGLGLGALLGGWIYRGSSFFSLLIISGILRFFIFVLIKVFTREVREVQRAGISTFLFDLSGLHFFGVLSKELLFKHKK